MIANYHNNIQNITWNFPRCPRLSSYFFFFACSQEHAGTDRWVSERQHWACVLCTYMAYTYIHICGLSTTSAWHIGLYKYAILTANMYLAYMAGWKWRYTRNTLDFPKCDKEFSWGTRLQNSLFVSRQAIDIAVLMWKRNLKPSLEAYTLNVNNCLASAQEWPDKA